MVQASSRGVMGLSQEPVRCSPGGGSENTTGSDYPELSSLPMALPPPHPAHLQICTPPFLAFRTSPVRYLTFSPSPCNPFWGASSHGHHVLVPCRASQAKDDAFWSFIIPGRFAYSFDLADVDTVQLSELWAKTLGVSRDPKEIKRALRNSYSFVAVLDQNEELQSSARSYRKLIGFGRAVSDGSFIATICDVAVDPAYQRRGIGRRIVKELVKEMQKRNGPSGFAVFPPPKTRRFFWNIGFRADRQFRFMAYRGKYLSEQENQ